MITMRNTILKFILHRLLRKRCIGDIPRSGVEGERINCYVILLIKKNENPIFLNNFNEDGYVGVTIIDNEKKTISIKNNELNDYGLNIRHYLGLCTIFYSSLANYLFLGLTGFNFIRCSLEKIFDKSVQYIFNKKKLVIYDRITLLRLIIDYLLNNHGKKFCVIDVLSLMHSTRWASHPDAELYERKVELILDSFVSSGELSNVDNMYYQVTAKAITSLSCYEENERRHTQLVNLQRIIAFFTIILALVGFLQIIANFSRK